MIEQGKLKVHRCFGQLSGLGSSSDILETFWDCKDLKEDQESFQNFCSSKIILLAVGHYSSVVGDGIAIILMVFLYACNIVISIDNKKRRLQFHARLAHIG